MADPAIVFESDFKNLMILICLFWGTMIVIPKDVRIPSLPQGWAFPHFFKAKVSITRMYNKRKPCLKGWPLRTA